MKYLAILFIIIPFSNAWSQTRGSVKGVVIDTALKQPVAEATVSLINPTDSSLVSFTRTDDNGKFQLRYLAKTSYKILISHTGYHNIISSIILTDSAAQIDLGYLTATNKSTQLSEVVLYSAPPPVTIKNDTIEFNAGSFRVTPNANVEDLIKKMPGVQVDKDGKIKVNGKEVKKILVDAKEFFSNDTKLASQNLPANIVDKVQVFDRKSDQSQFTGFDDGNSEQTINLTLKKDKKTGLFGKATTGIGNKERYQGSYSINQFKGKRQLSSIGMINNTNKQAFTFMDLMNFDGAQNAVSGRDGKTDNSSSVNGTANGNASSIKKTTASGVNFNNDWRKIIISGSYFFNDVIEDIQKKTSREYLLPGNTFKRLQNDTSRAHNTNHRLNFSIDYTLDSMNSVKWTTAANIQNQETSGSSSIANHSAFDTSTGIIKNNSSGDGYSWSNSLLWRHKFAKKGRTLSTNYSFEITDKSKSSNLYSLNSGSGRNPGTINSLNQATDQSLSSGQNSLSVSYTEPFSKQLLLELGYQYREGKTNSERATQDYDIATGKYSIYNSLLSNKFSNKQAYHRESLKWRFQQGKVSITAGAYLQQASLKNNFTAASKDSSVQKNFTNLLPSLQFKYNINRYQNLRLQYDALTTMPSASQLNPITDNTDPYNLKRGNPSLTQEYTQQVRLHYMSIDPFRHRNLFGMVDARFTSHAVVNSERIDSGVVSSQPINANGTYTVNSFVNMGTPIGFMKASISTTTMANHSKNISFINNQKNNINNFSIGEEVSINYSHKKWLDVSVGAQVTYNHTSYSVIKTNNASYWNQQYSLNTNLYLPKSFSIGSDFTYNKYSGFSNGFNTSVPQWNLGLAKSVFKNNKAEIRIQAFDLLNKNIGITRTSNQNYIEDVQSNILTRYFLFSFTYNISRFAGKNVAGQQRGMGGEKGFNIGQ